MSKISLLTWGRTANPCHDPPMVLATGEARRLGRPDTDAVVRIGVDTQPDGTRTGRRLMWVGAEPAFELSFWCGTCPALFERLGANTETPSLDDLSELLAYGLEELDEDVINRFADLLGEGTYVPMLLEIEPSMAKPMSANDYFANEQVNTWGINAFWGLPENPKTPYYRTFETPVSKEAHLYEFVVPMVPPNWNDSARVDEFKKQLGKSSSPTAVAVSTLDICAPAMDHSTDYYTHWNFTHFLLDGHHKMQAAADTGKRLRLLTLISVDNCLASLDDIKTLHSLRSQARVARGK